MKTTDTESYDPTTWLENCMATTTVDDSDISKEDCDNTDTAENN